MCIVLQHDAPWIASCRAFLSAPPFNQSPFFREESGLSFLGGMTDPGEESRRRFSGRCGKVVATLCGTCALVVFVLYDGTYLAQSAATRRAVIERERERERERDRRGRNLPTWHPFPSFLVCGTCCYQFCTFIGSARLLAPPSQPNRLVCFQKSQGFESSLIKKIKQSFLDRKNFVHKII